MTRKWGKTGVRLDPTEAEAARHRHAATANKLAAARAAHDAEGERLWKAGKLVPWAITVALDAAGLQGPQVDADCLTTEPTVDHWEAGIAYPTWEQTLALARLCGVGVRVLCMEPLPGRVFMCQRGGTPMDDGPPPVLTFTQAALAARLNP